MGIEE